MKILAIEFSSEQRSVAICNGTVDGRISVPEMVVQAGGEKINPLALIEEALRAARLEREQIDCVAVGLGPGSYTGIRMAISIAQGWQLARDVRTLGVSSVECLAARAQLEKIGGRVSIVIDAQRKEFYLAVYDLAGPSPRPIVPLHLATFDDVQARRRLGEILAGPGVDKWFPGARTVFPDAAMVGRLAATRPDPVPGEELEPIYVRETNFVKAAPPRFLR